MAVVIAAFDDAYAILPPLANFAAEDEIFITEILRNLNYLAPRTIKVKARVNKVTSTMLFQEKAAKELLEFNSFKEGIIIKCDERFAWFDDYSTEKLSYNRAWNTKFSEKSEKNM